MGGVYVMRHRESGAFYVGSTADFRTREHQHRAAIRSGRCSAPLRRLAGGDPAAFTFSPLIVCAQADLELYEDRALAVLGAQPGCLNVRPRSDRRRRRVISTGLHRLHVPLPPDLAAAMRAESRRTGITVVELARRALAAYLSSPG